MSEASFASLGPTLLARKGGAKPAMRPQLAPLPETVNDDQLEDLGWNDMGGDADDDDGAVAHHGGADIVSIKPAKKAHAEQDHSLQAMSRPLAEEPFLIGTNDIDDASEDDADTEVALPDYTSEEDETTEEIEAREDALLKAKPAKVQPAKAKPETLAPQRIAHHETAPVLARKAKRKPARRAAFTLRLDPERHLKLRLAATIEGISAQALVTEALDALLSDFEELDALTRHMGDRSNRH